MAAEVGFILRSTGMPGINPLVWEQDPPSLGITGQLGLRPDSVGVKARFWESPIVKRLNLGAVSKFATNTYWKLPLAVPRAPFASTSLG